MRSYSLIILLFGTFLSNAQISAIEKNKDFCYRLNGQKAPVKGSRFAEWECGKIAGIVDCNEKLELSSDQNFVVTSSNKQPFSGECETCHQNGVLERRVKFVNGKAEGVDTSTYQSGCVLAIRMHIAGAEHGKWQFFEDSTFNPSWEKNYSVGELNGPQLTWGRRKDASGNVIYDTTKFEVYINGILNGKKVSYSKGKRTKEVTYKNGLIEGPFLVYNKEGVIIEELTFKEGKKNGVFKYYYDDGVLLKTENWEMDVRNGEFKTFYYNQTIQSIENYKKGNGKQSNYLTTQTFELSSKKDADEVFKMLEERKPLNEISTLVKDKLTGTIFSDERAEPESKNYLREKMLKNGPNKPFEINAKYYVVLLTKVDIIQKAELREGWFEERFPDQKVKRKALYKKDILIEEHVFDSEGREISSFGGVATAGSEDDAIPGESKKDKKARKKREKIAAKEKKKQDKKEKKTKGTEETTPVEIK